MCAKPSLIVIWQLTILPNFRIFAAGALYRESAFFTDKCEQIAP